MICAVIVLNIVVGFFQEFSAEKTLNSIRALGSPTARVIRDGQSKVVPTGDLVPGDIVELAMGNTVPADLRYGPTPLVLTISKQPQFLKVNYQRNGINLLTPVD